MSEILQSIQDAGFLIPSVALLSCLSALLVVTLVLSVQLRTLRHRLNSLSYSANSTEIKRKTENQGIGNNALQLSQLHDNQQATDPEVNTGQYFNRGFTCDVLETVNGNDDQSDLSSPSYSASSGQQKQSRDTPCESLEEKICEADNNNENQRLSIDSDRHYSYIRADISTDISECQRRAGKGDQQNDGRFYMRLIGNSANPRENSGLWRYMPLQPLAGAECQGACSVENNLERTGDQWVQENEPEYLEMIREEQLAEGHAKTPVLKKTEDYCDIPEEYCEIPKEYCDIPEEYCEIFGSSNGAEEQDEPDYLVIHGDKPAEIPGQQNWKDTQTALSENGNHAEHPGQYYSEYPRVTHEADDVTKAHSGAVDLNEILRLKRRWKDKQSGDQYNLAGTLDDEKPSEDYSEYMTVIQGSESTINVSNGRKEQDYPDYLTVIQGNESTNDRTVDSDVTSGPTHDSCSNLEEFKEPCVGEKSTDVFPIYVNQCEALRSYNGNLVDDCPIYAEPRQESAAGNEKFALNVEECAIYVNKEVAYAGFDSA